MRERRENLAGGNPGGGFLPSSRRRGFSLIEVTIAMGIFVVVMGVTAQCLISFYCTMEAQDQRVRAANYVESIFTDMRYLRDCDPNDPESMKPPKVGVPKDLNPHFRTDLLTRYPNGTTVAGPTTIRGSSRVVAYESTTAEPLKITVTLTYKDIRGRTMTTAMTGIVASQ